MTMPPPPPGDSQPTTPGGSSFPPPPGAPTGGPSYGAGSGMPPQAPPPAPGGAPQGGSDSTKILAWTSLGTGIAGIVICCCWGLPIFSIAALITGFIAKNQTKTSPRPDLQRYITIGLITGAVGLVISVIYWILVITGVIDVNAYTDM